MRNTKAIPLMLAMALAVAVPAYAQQGHAAHHPDQSADSPQGQMAEDNAGTMSGGMMKSGMMSEGMMGDGMMGDGMMGPMMDAPSPGMLLRHREALGIDDAQAERLEALRDEMMSTRDRVSGQTLEVLTQDQRTRLEEMKASMHAGMMKGEAMGAMMGGQDGMAGMDACPMMGEGVKASTGTGPHGHGAAGNR